MSIDLGQGQKGEILLEMQEVVIDGFSDERWHEIIRGINLTLRRGQVLGLIGESGGLHRSASGKGSCGLRIGQNERNRAKSRIAVCMVASKTGGIV